MAKPAIIRGSEHFFNVLYEGNGGGQRVGKFIPFTDNGTIAKSVIMDKASSPRLSRTPSSAGNRKTWTLSLWVKRTLLASPRHMILTQSNSGGTAGDFFFFNTDNTIKFTDDDSGDYNLVTNRTFEDTSKFYHIVLAVDTTQSTASNRVKLYVDGDQITSFGTSSYPAQDYTFHINNTAHPMNLFSDYGNSGSEYSDGYIAEVNLVDGTALTPSTFGLTDTSTGRWIPKSLTGITYGTNGFRMEFANSAGQTIGDDTSGNGNDYAVTNVATTDLTTDSPTQNHAILSSSFTAGTVTLSEGNLTLLGSGSSVYGSSRSTFEIDVDDPTGYYFEARNTGSATDNINIGFQDVGTALSATAYGGSNFYGLVSRGGGGSNQYWRINGGSTDITTSVGHSSNDWIGVAIKQGKVWFAINNTYVFSGNPVTGATPFLDISAFAKRFFITIECFQNNKLECNFGQKSFNYSAPSGYVSIQQDNLPETTKDLADFVWIKNRDQADAHALYDSSRGPLNEWHISEDVPAAVPDGLTKFLNGGFAVEDEVAVNSSGESYVAWCWHANGGTTAANTAGSGANVATTVQANQTAGFSICEFTGTGSNLRFAHGLSQAPEWIIIKRLEGSGAAQQVYHVGYGADQYTQLNEADAKVTTGAATTNFIETPTATYVDLGSNSNSNNSGDKSVAYCWHSVAGFSKFGIYLGNGSSNGPLIITGFKPAWLMIKDVDNSRNWIIIDNARDPFNPTDKGLASSNSNAENTGNAIDFLSNGFKFRSSSTSFNTSAAYIYMAFAEHPFLGDGTNPVTAR